MPLPDEFWLDPIPPPETEDQCKQRLLREALQTSSGRQRLGASMAGLIRDRIRNRMFQPIDQLPGVEPVVVTGYTKQLHLEEEEPDA
jgi:hypothetical protein